ncbi:MAG: BatA domain-containing protein [Kiritimatiellia bacterium]
MQFVTPLLLLGVLAIAIPIIIHLLTRKNSRRIFWGAMLFLSAAMKKRKRSVLLEEILLLATRCLIPVMAALALARPFVTPDSEVPWGLVLPAILLSAVLFGARFALWHYPKWRRITLAAAIVLALFSAISILFEHRLNLKRFGGGSRRDVVLVIDGSASMCMPGSDGKTNFENAVEEAAKYVEEAPRGTSFSVILGGPAPDVLVPVPISDRRILRETFQQLRPTQGTMNAPAAIAAAAVSLSAGSNPARQIVIIGDGQAVGWGLESSGRLESLRAILGQLNPRPRIVWRTLPLPATVRNLAVSNIALSRNPVGTDREVAIRVTVENAGTEAVTPDSVSVRVGSKTLADTSARQLEPGASQTFDFHYRFESPGASVITATVESKDDMPADDTARLVVPVLDTLRVLIVDGDAPVAAEERGSTYVSLALRPDLVKAVAGQKRDFLLETTVEDVMRAASRTDFSAFSVVVLCNVARLSDASMAALSAHVRKGAGLFLIPGHKAQPDVYNNWSDAGEEVLPLKLGRWIVNPPNSPTLPLIDTASFNHDALALLRTSRELRRIAPLRLWQLLPAPSPVPTTIASLNDGTPLFGMKTLGLGTVALSAVPFDPASSDLPLRSTFVPLLHELVYHIARPVSPELNVIPMDSAEIRLMTGRPDYDPRRYAQPGKPQPQTPPPSATWHEICNITSPRGERFHGQLKFSPDGTFLVIDRAILPGLYTVSSSNPNGFPKKMAPVLTQTGEIAIQVKSGIEESSLFVLSAEQSSLLLDNLQLTVATRKEDILQLLKGSAFGSEIWRTFAIFLLALLIAEVALTRWIAIRRRSGEQIDVDFTNEGELGKASFKEALSMLHNQ